MRVATPAATDPGFITLCIQLAQSTFSDVMPSRTEPEAKAIGTRSKPVGVKRDSKWLSAIGDWFHRQQVSEREAYLATSVDIFELERRIRNMDRRPYY
jgi:Protein of unknown function (DUF3563)